MKVVAELEFRRVSSREMEQIRHWTGPKGAPFCWNKLWNPNIALDVDAHLYVAMDRMGPAALFGIGSTVDTPQPENNVHYLNRTDGYCPLLVVMNPTRFQRDLAEDLICSALQYAKSSLKVKRFRTAIDSTDQEGQAVLKSVGFCSGGSFSESWFGGMTESSILIKDAA